MKRLLGTVLPGLLCVVLFGITVFVLILPSMESAIMAQKRQTTLELVQTVTSVLAGYERQVKSGALSLAQAQSRALGQVRAMRYGPQQKDYFWIHKKNLRMLMHPYRTDLEGKDLSQFQDLKGKRLFVEMTENALEKGSAYVNYFWQWKDDPQRMASKLSYVQVFKPWGWIVGTGLYLDDVQAEMDQLMGKLALVGLGILAVVMLLSGWLTLRGLRAQRARLSAEDALRQSEYKYRTVFDSGNDAMFMLKNRRVIYCNQKALELFQADHDQVVGHSPLKFSVHTQPDGSDSREIGLKRLEEAEAGEAQYYDWRFKRTDGILLDCEVGLKRIDLQNESLVLAVARDITSRKQDQRELSSQKAYFEKLFAGSPEAVTVTDPAGIIQRVNQEFTLLFGYTQEEAQGRALSELVAGSGTRTESGELIRQVLGGELVRTTGRRRRKDGTLVNVAISGTAVMLDQENQGIFFLYRDTTEMVRTLEALKQSEGNYRTIFDSSREAIIVHDIGSGAILDVNRRMLDMFRLSHDEALLQDVASLSAAESGKALAGIQGMMRKAVTRGPQLFEWQCRRNSGKPFWTEAHIKRVSIGGEDRLLTFVRDISQRKEAEAEQQRLESQLLHSQKLEAVGTLAGGIAHDFNNILTSIIGFTELCKNKLDAGKKPDNEMQNVLEASFRARDLVKQILAFSRQEKSELVALDMAVMVKETMKLVQAATPPLVDIKTRVQTQWAPVWSDPVQINQVLMNLCTNAIQAMGTGGGQLRVGLKERHFGPGQVPYATMQPGDYVQLTVGDTGPGISQDDMGRVFDPFFTTKPVGEGTGLGLSVVHGIVTKLGGTVLLDSEPGRGATFRVYLPLVPNAAPPLAGEDDVQPVPSDNSGRILMVDDEEMVLAACKPLMERLGFEVEAISSPLEARRRFEQDPSAFDLVITDFAMPHMSGLELSASIKEISLQTPVILCTGYGETLDRKEISNFGVDAVILKPFSSQQLVLLINRTLSGSGS